MLVAVRSSDGHRNGGQNSLKDGGRVLGFHAVLAAPEVDQRAIDPTNSIHPPASWFLSRSRKPVEVEGSGGGRLIALGVESMLPILLFETAVSNPKASDAAFST